MTREQAETALREAHAAAPDMDEERDDVEGAESQMVELLVRDAEKQMATAKEPPGRVRADA